MSISPSAPASQTRHDLNERVVTELVIDGRGAQMGSAQYVQAMQAAQSAVDRFIDRQRALEQASTGGDHVMTQSATSTTRLARSFDRLKASLDPAHAAARAMERDIVTLDKAVSHLGVSELEAARLLDQVKLKHDAVAAAAKRQSDEYLRLAAAARETQAADVAQGRFNQFMGVRDPRMMAGSARQSASVFMNMSEDATQAAQSVGLARHEVTNLSYQMNDVAMMLATGQSPFMLMMQQGSQVSQIMGKRGLGEIIPALGTGLMSLITPTTLFLAGITAAGYAGYQAFRAIQPEAKEAEDVLERHSELLKQIEEGYGRVAEEARGAMSGSAGSMRLGVAASEADLRLLASNAGREFLGGLGSSGYQFSSDEVVFGEIFNVRSEFKAFEDAIRSLNDSARQGTPDVETFRRMVTERWQLDPNNSALTQTAAQLLETSEAFAELARRMEEARRAREAFDRDIDASGRLRPFSSVERDSMRELGAYRVEQEVARRRAQEAFEAETLGMTARSPSERAAAARAREASSYNGDESAEARRNRIELAGRRALIEAEHELAEAQLSRRRSLDETMAVQRLEAQLIGQTVGEVERLRMEFELTAELREEAARNGVAIDQQELALIREKAAEYGRLAEQIARTNLVRELQFEREQLFRTESERGIASRLRGAGLPINLNSPEARYMRETERIEELRAGVRGFFNDIQEGLLRGDDIGQALGKAILNALNRVLDRVIDQLLNQVVNAIVGGGGGGAGGGLLGALFGGIGGGGAANNNWFPAAPTITGPSPLSPAGGALAAGGWLDGSRIQGIATTAASAALTAAGGVQGQVWNFFAQRGLAPHQIAGVMGHVGAESAFNPAAIGDGGNALGLFQWNNRGPAMQQFVGPDWRTNVQGQLQFAWHELQGSENRALRELTASGNVRGATQAFGGFERARGFSWNNPEGIHNWEGRLEGAEQALERFGGATTQATSSLGTVGQAGQVATRGLSEAGQGLTSFGRNMANYFPAAPGGGGGGGFGGIGGAISSMLNPIFSGTSAFRWLTANPGQFIGLYHEGGIAGSPSSTRFVGPGAFMNAPRYHNGGIAGDEVPAILRRGEPVFKSMDHARQTVGGARVNVTVINNAGVRVQTQEREGANGGVDMDVIIDRVVAEKLGDRGTASNNTLRKRFGAQPALKRRA